VTKAIGSRGWTAGWLALALASASVSAPALAQIAPESKGPIDITADEAEVVNSTCVTTWRGTAEALQGTSRLRANVITAYLKPKGQPGPNGQAGCGATDKIVADGDVFYVTPTQVVRGDHAVYTADNAQIVMTGNVIVVQGLDVAHGDRMTVDVNTRVVHMDSAAKGLGTPGRVRGVFYPNQPGGPGAPTGAPKPASAP
jgi:lipopolysaccharide export system protein LptA